MNYEEYVSELIKPIAANKPCGDSVKELAEYETIRSEIEKLGGIENRSIDWSLVVDLGEKLTREKGKDLSVIGFSTVGRLHTSGIAGYTAAIDAVSTILDKHWDTVQPERERSKLVALQWLIGESEKHLGQAKIKNREDLELISARWQALDAVMRNRLNGKAPNPSSVFSLIERKKNEIREKATPSTPKPSNDTAKAITEITNDNELKLALKQAQDQLFAISKYLREKSLSDKNTYYFNRMAVGIAALELPVSKDNITALLPPAPNQTLTFATLAKDGKHEALVKELEVNLRRFPWWIAGYRMQLESLAKLGPAFDEARQLVEVELGSFLNKNKKIFELKYANNEDIVSSDTKTWLEQHVLHVSTAKSGKDLAFEVDQHIEETLRRVDELALNKQYQSAVDMLEDEIDRQRRPRNKLRLQLEKAKLVERQDYSEVTAAVLERLLESIENTHVAAWEGELTEQVLVMLLTNYEKAIEKNKQNAGRYGDKVRACFGKLVDCNVRTAMQFEQKESIRKIL